MNNWKKQYHGNKLTLIILLLVFSILHVDAQDTIYSPTLILKQRIDLSEWKGGTFKLQAAAKFIKSNSGGDGNIRLWARIDAEDGSTRFFDNMDDRKITSPNWALYSIEGKIDSSSTGVLVFGALAGTWGEFYIDEFKLSVKPSNGYWQNIEIPNGGFDERGVNGLNNWEGNYNNIAGFKWKQNKEDSFSGRYSFYANRIPKKANYHEYEIAKKPLQFDIITKDDGLPSNYVFRIIQDSKDFIWIGTENGLVRYDGYTYITYAHDPLDSLSISANDVWEIYEDNFGNLWIGTASGGLNKFDRNSEEFTRYVHNPSDTLSLSHNYITKIFEDSQSVIWVGTRGGGLNRLNSSSGKFKRYQYNAQNKLGIKSNWVTAINEDLQGNLWIGSRGNSIAKLNNDDDTFDYWEREQMHTKDWGNRYIQRIYRDNQGIFWMVGVFGLYRFDPITRKYKLYLSKYEQLKPDNSGGMLDIAPDGVGNLWILRGESYDITISKFNLETEEEVFYPISEYNNLGSAPWIIDILIDTEGSLWMGSLSYGIRKQNTVKPRFQQFMMDHTEFLELEEMNLATTIEDKFGSIWMASNTGLEIGLIMLDVTGKINYYSVESESSKNFPTNEIYTLFEDSDGDLWISYVNEGVGHYDNKSSEFVLLGTQGINALRHVRCIFQDHNGVIWLGTWTGLFRVDKETQTYHQEKWLGEDNQLNRWDDVFSVYEGRDHILYIGTNTGKLYKYDPYTNKRAEIILDTENITDINYSKYSISALYEDSRNRLWIGTQGNGLWMYEKETGNTFNASLKYNLLISIIYGIVEDGNNNLWLSGNGLAKFNPDSGYSRIYNTSDGLASDDLSVAFKSNKSSIVYIPSGKGLISFYPDSIKINRSIPNIVLTDFTFYSPEVESGEMKVIRGSDEKDEIIFSYKENIISCQFSALSFFNSKKNKYRYKLEGFNDDWFDLGTKRELTFTNLNPGKYILQIQGSNGDGVWNEVGKTIKITITPPWYWAWYTKLIYALLFIGGLYYWIRGLNRKIQKEQEHSEALELLNVELNEINAANQKFVPQDFMNILGKSSIRDLKLGDQTSTHMTVLFADIRSYTQLSETMSPDENFRFINGYLGRVGPLIKSHGGFIDKYMGDGLMALFLDNHLAAIRASVEIQKALNKYNRERDAKDRQPIKTGIGLNTGPLMLGIIGDQERYDSTVIADSVNTASRMEGLTKIFGASIILSGKTLKELTSKQKTPDYAYRYLGKIRVKGRDKAVDIYDLYEGDPVSVRQLKAKTQSAFEDGLGHYANREFGKAAEFFKKVLEVNESDKAAQYYLDKCVDYIVNNVPEGWAGVEEMVMK